MISEELMEIGYENSIILDSFVKADSVINDPKYKNIMVSISGGSDSDLMIDLCEKIKGDKTIHYVWFDTGLEYQATKDHLTFLEEKYDVTIVRERAVKPIPLTVRQYGQPFLSKHASEMISRLQKHNFKWEDKSFDELLKEYPNCKCALKWWCNVHEKSKNGMESRFNIAFNRYLKEFMIENPPTFNVSNKCCTWAKKKVAANYKENHSIDLSLVGVRKAEGGVRATSYANCFTAKEDVSDEYRPLFWYTDKDKFEYTSVYGVVNSKCYREYGLTRTGCAGCPFGQKFEDELVVIETYEPKLYKAVNNIFGDSYEYTRKYREFQKKMKQADKDKKN